MTQSGKQVPSMRRRFRCYLLFMLLACGGAFLWQFFLPSLSTQYSSWAGSVGWQREIALWNVGIISAIVMALFTNNTAYLKILTFQSTVLCLALGANHLFSLLSHFSVAYLLHILGVFEVLLLGGGWGMFLLWQSRHVPE